jgi:hypothetical protein
MSQIASLSEVLAYQNENVIAMFRESFAVPLADAEALFDDVKRWLWLRAKRRGEKLVLVPAMTPLDELWHCFILFTVDYAAFCQRYFGELVHHVPPTRAEREAYAALAERDPETFRAQEREHHRFLISLVIDELGADVARRWFAEYKQRYPTVMPPRQTGAATGSTREVPAPA